MHMRTCVSAVVYNRSGVAMVTRWHLLLLMLVTTCWSQRTDPGSTPCPSVCQYFWDEAAGQWQGLISIVPPTQLSEVAVKVKMTVTYYPLVAGYGNIDIYGGPNEMEAITRRVLNLETQTLRFKINFPQGQPTPRISSILINDKEFCPNTLTFTDTRAQISLQYNMKTGVEYPVANGQEFRVADPAGASRQPEVKPQRPVAARRPSRPPVPTQPAYVPTQPAYVPTQPAYVPTQPAYVPTQPAYVPTEPPYVPRPRPTTRAPPPPRPTPRPYQPEYVPNIYDSTDLNSINMDTCGIPSANELVIRGERAAPGEWPWHVAIKLHTSRGNSFQCGGTLVSIKHVLTAAHCVYNKSTKRSEPAKNFVVFLGRYDLALYREDNEQIIVAEHIVVHPLYNYKGSRDRDIAVIFLSQEAVKTSTVMPACLWAEGDADLNKIVGKRGTVVGWGKDEHGVVAETLRTARMPVVSQQECRARDRFYQIHTSDNTFCAGFRNGTSVCNGDSGGGLHFYRENPVQHNQDMWFVRGIVSISKIKPAPDDDLVNTIVCDDESFVVFTDVAKLMPWIRQTIASPPDTPSRIPLAAEDTYQQPPAPVSPPSKPPAVKVECGRSVVPVALILQGMDTHHGEHPWHVALYLTGIGYACGGTLISRRAVVTAAHCVKHELTTDIDISSITLKFGRYDITLDNEEGAQERTVSTVLVHPDFNKFGSVENDIAILTVTSPVEYTKYVRPICLMPADKDDYNDIVAVPGTAVGWGLHDDLKISSVLRMAKMPVVDGSKCLVSDRDFFGQFFGQTNFCAGDLSGTSVCNGDSGGGLMFPYKGSAWVLRGIVSISHAVDGSAGGPARICNPKKYILFTNAAVFTSWIKENADLS